MALVKSWVEIDAGRLVGNLLAVQDVVGADVDVLAVVKANGYGHAATAVAPVLVGGGARWLGVTDVEEGVAVRAALGSPLAAKAASEGEDATYGLKPVPFKALQAVEALKPVPFKAGQTLDVSEGRILVMCGMEVGDAPAMVEYGLTPVVWTVEHVAAMEAAAEAAGVRVALHLEIDTGMARQGAVVGQKLALVLERLAASRWVRCEGVMSHLSSSEVAGSAVTAAQMERFGAALAQVSAAGIRPEWVHLGNTSAVDEGSTMQWVRSAAARMGARAMVRTGLAVYGDCLEVEGGVGQLRGRLLSAMTWKTRVIGLREIAAGATVGYGGTFVAEAPMRIALLAVGYADGFRREASSGVGDGWVMVRGERARVVGRVSMNLTTVDVTGIAGVEVGDAVVLLGDGVSADDHARWCGTIAYEILCGVKGRVVVV